MSNRNVNLAGEQQPGNQDYVAPTSGVPLPSRGIVYSQEHSLNNKDMVDIRSMTARDEDILTSVALLKQGRAMSALLKSCMIDKSIDPDSMISGDRNAVLVAIRITGYGADYGVEVSCPNCSENVKHRFNLGELPIKPLEVTPVKENTNEFQFTLPISQKTITFKLMTGADEKELSTILENLRKKTGSETPITTRLKQQIISVDGVTDRSKVAKFVMEMPAGDSRSLRKHMDDITPGIKMEQSFTCTSCNVESEVEVPMGAEFFWPSE